MDVRATPDDAFRSGQPEAECHLHQQWRHSHAMALFGQGVDIHKVHRLLGHSRIVTTARYLHLTNADLADALNAAFRAPSVC